MDSRIANMLIDEISSAVAPHVVRGELGQIPEAVSAAVEKVLGPYVPAIQQKLVEIVAPAAQKASEVIGPVVQKKIMDALPYFALGTGLVLFAALQVGRMMERRR